MSAAISIRKYRSGDESAIKSLVVSIMGGEFREDAAAYPTEDLESIEKSYGKIGDIFFVAEAGPRVIGTVAIKKEDDRIALLRRLFVDPEFRNQKLGVKLIDRALEFCREVGYQELVFRTTSRMEGAIRLCQKKGFTQRAKIQLGEFELLKFTLHLANGQPAVKSA